MILFRNVNKHYGNFHVLKNINLSIERGEVVVILGPSGSGKSTMLRCINRLETISDGELIVNDIPIHDKKTDINKLRRNIGMVFQHFNLYPHKKVIDNITLAPKKVAKISDEEAKLLQCNTCKKSAFQKKLILFHLSYLAVNSRGLQSLEGLP